MNKAYEIAPPPGKTAYYKGIRRIQDKNKGFTLAEVLITLGVIGVIAALTLPGLITKYDEVVMVNKLKRTYSELANAIELEKNELGASDYTTLFAPELSAAEQLDGFVKYLNVVERCTAESKGCGGTYYIKPTKRTNDGNGNVQTKEMRVSSAERAILNDGTIVWIGKTNWTQNCEATFAHYDKDENGNYTNVVDGKPVPVYYTSTMCAEIFFDINGTKRKNQFGYDVFSFAVKPQKISQHGNYGSFYNTMLNGKLEYENYSGGKF